MAADVAEGITKSGRYTDSEDEVSARVRKNHQWWFTGRVDAQAQLDGKKGFILEETLWLMKIRWGWPESAVEEYMRGYRSIIKDDV
jgi:hypothetical protein